MTRQDENPEEDPKNEAQPLEMNGVLDLHTFAPEQVKELVPVWLDECRDLGLLDLRIIHGKGQGVLRRIVHSILDRRQDVESYGHPAHGGSWGATVVRLKEKP